MKKKIKKFFKFIGNTILMITFVAFVLIIAILFLLWWIWDCVFKFFFPKKWEENTKRREKEFDDWMYEQTKDQGWAWQDLR